MSLIVYEIKKAQQTWVSLLNMINKRKKHGFHFFESSKNMNLILGGIWFWKFRRHEFNCLKAKNVKNMYAFNNYVHALYWHAYPRACLELYPSENRFGNFWSSQGLNPFFVFFYVFLSLLAFATYQIHAFGLL